MPGLRPPLLYRWLASRACFRHVVHTPQWLGCSHAGTTAAPCYRVAVFRTVPSPALRCQLQGGCQGEVQGRSCWRRRQPNLRHPGEPRLLPCSNKVMHCSNAGMNPTRMCTGVCQYLVLRPCLISPCRIGCTGACPVHSFTLLLKVSQIVDMCQP